MSAIIMRADPKTTFAVIGVAGEDLRHGDVLILIPDPGKGDESAKSIVFEEIPKKEGNHTTKAGGPE